MSARTNGLPRNCVGRPKGPNKATTPLMRSVIDAIDRSGFDDAYVAKRAGIGKNEISNWRTGYRGNPTVIRLSWVLEAIGHSAVIVDDKERQR